MDLQLVRDSLEKAAVDILPNTALAALPSQFYDGFITKGIQIDRIEPGRVICSMRVPPRLLNNGNFLHGGATASLVDIIGSSALLSAGCPTSGVSLEINISYLDAAYANGDCGKVADWQYSSRRLKAV